MFANLSAKCKPCSSPREEFMVVGGCLSYIDCIYSDIFFVLVLFSGTRVFSNLITNLDLIYI